MIPRIFSSWSAAVPVLAVAALLVCSAKSVAQPFADASFRSFPGGGSRLGCEDESPFPRTCERSTTYPNGVYSEHLISTTHGGEVPEAFVGGDNQANDSTAWNQAWAMVHYSAVITSLSEPPPVAEVPVLVRMHGSMGVQRSGVGYARACSSANVTVPGFGTLADAGTCVDTTGAGPLEDSYDVTRHVFFPVGLAAETSIESSIELRPGGVGQSGSATAIVFTDPVFTIDPSFPYADQFAITYSDNLGLFDDGFETGAADRWSVSTDSTTSGAPTRGREPPLR